MSFKDKDGQPLVDKILDTAGQKGTGKWASAAALDLGVPLTLISEAVFARCLSALKNERVEASKLLRGPSAKFTGDKGALAADLEKALYASKIVSYAQGFTLFREAAKEFKWSLDYGGIALLWRGGCIIRSAFLGKIKDAFVRRPEALRTCSWLPFSRTGSNTLRMRGGGSWPRLRPTAYGRRPCRRR